MKKILVGVVAFAVVVLLAGAFYHVVIPIVTNQPILSNKRMVENKFKVGEDVWWNGKNRSPYTYTPQMVKVVSFHYSRYGNLYLYNVELSLNVAVVSEVPEANLVKN